MNEWKTEYACVRALLFGDTWQHSLDHLHVRCRIVVGININSLSAAILFDAPRTKFFFPFKCTHATPIIIIIVSDGECVACETGSNLLTDILIMLYKILYSLCFAHRIHIDSDVQHRASNEIRNDFFLSLSIYSIRVTNKFMCVWEKKCCSYKWQMQLSNNFCAFFDVSNIV